jgi:hypothetical protein
VSEVQRPRRMGRGICAVLAGVLTGMVLSIGTDMMLHGADVFPTLGPPMPDSLLLLATAYRTLYGVAGAYVTARLAPNRPMQHALVLGALGLAACSVGAAVTWNKGPAFGPHWYPLALVVFALPPAWAGGGLRVMQLRPRVYV